MKFFYGSVFGFLVAAFYYTGALDDAYRSMMPAKTVEEQADDVLGRAQGESKVVREFKYLSKKIGFEF
ncbi:MAG: hypothetical protein ACI9TY_000725 [Alphaproteobacteria bacterium]|jgi:hypothetical protein